MNHFLLLFLLTFSCSSMAEWVAYFTKANGDIFFYDNTRVQKNEQHIHVWNRVRYKTSVMAASSYQSFMQIDCSERSTTTLQSTFYIDKHWTTPAMATDTKQKPKTPIVEQSATAQLANLLCTEYSRR